jgi:hypothetical protein
MEPQYTYLLNGGAKSQKFVYGIGWNIDISVYFAWYDICIQSSARRFILKGGDSYALPYYIGRENQRSLLFEWN